MATQPFTVYVIQSAHTDIGYTHPQEQIANMYLEHYDLVLDLCKKTAHDPVEHRFKWTCETFWQVQHYLANRPERQEEFLAYVRSGQIEMCATYLHFADLIDTDAYRRSVQLAVDFCQQHSLPLYCALHCDINGWPWSVADILADFKIPYFCSQVHIDSGTDPLGKRGSVHYHWLIEIPWLRQDSPIRIPQAFWWTGPQGGRVLHWLNEHYLLGNVLGVSSQQPFGADKTQYFYETDHLKADDLYKIASQNLPPYIERLRRDGYPNNAMLLSTGGFYVDNSRPDHRWCQIIERWNTQHDDIKLRTATLHEWFEALESWGTKDLPVYRVAWPDHWAHGLGSATARIAQARRVQRRRADIIKLVEGAGSSKASKWLDRALEEERFALEHTFCAWSTTAHPEAPANHFQQIAKELRFHRAELYLDEAAGAALRNMIPVGDRPVRLYVTNSSDQQNVERLIQFDAGDMEINPGAQMLRDEHNQTHAIQVDHDGLRQFVSVLPVSPGKLNAFELVSKQAQHMEQGQSNVSLTSQAWELQLDPQTGGLTSLRERTTGRDWVAAKADQTFGQIVHEAVVHPLGREAVGNLARFLALDIATDEARHLWVNKPIVEHTTLTIQGEPRVNPGTVFDALIVAGHSPRLGEITISWRCYHKLPLVELVIDWNKVWCDLPEAVYVAFPFAISNGTLELETAGSFFRPGDHGTNGQLPGTCSSYYTVQRAARIVEAQSELLWLPLDAPLVMTNALNYNRWETSPYKWNGLLASMPVNHYWHTNFPTSQRGHIRLRYRFISAKGYSDKEAALSVAMPLDALGFA